MQRCARCAMGADLSALLKGAGVARRLIRVSVNEYDLPTQIPPILLFVLISVP